MKLNLSIDTTNAAFDGDDRGPELARILRELADRLEDGRFGPMDTAAPLRDINGNRVGMALFVAPPDMGAAA